MAQTLQQSFTLTRHAMDRIKERFPEAMTDIMFEQSAAIRNRKLYEFLWNSTLENRVINDTMFMQYAYEKYGFDKQFKFFANGDMLFIGVIATDGNYIVTVVNRSTYVCRYLRPTVRKLQKKPNTFQVKQTNTRVTVPKKAPRRVYFEQDDEE